MTTTKKRRSFSSNFDIISRQANFASRSRHRCFGRNSDLQWLLRKCAQTFIKHLSCVPASYPKQGVLPVNFTWGGGVGVGLFQLRNIQRNLMEHKVCSRCQQCRPIARTARLNMGSDSFRRLRPQSKELSTHAPHRGLQHRLPLGVFIAYKRSYNPDGGM